MKEAAKSKNNSKKTRSILFRIALLVFICYVAVVLIQLQLEINDKQAEIDSKQAEIQEYEHLNGDLQNKVDNEDLYIGQQARENGYVAPNADVYVENP